MPGLASEESTAVHVLDELGIPESQGNPCTGGNDQIGCTGTETTNGQSRRRSHEKSLLREVATWPRLYSMVLITFCHRGTANPWRLEFHWPRPVSRSRQLVMRRALFSKSRRAKFFLRRSAGSTSTSNQRSDRARSQYFPNWELTQKGSGNESFVSHQDVWTRIQSAWPLRLPYTKPIATTNDPLISKKNHSGEIIAKT